MIVGSWHWTDCRGGYCGLSWGQAGMPLRATTETRAEAMGPWAFNTGAANSLGCNSFSDRSDSIFRKHS